MNALKIELKEQRFKNFDLLLEEFGEARIFKELDASPQRKYQLIHHKGSFGGNLARTLEAKCGLEFGWMDKEHPEGLLSTDRLMTDEYFEKRLNELLEMIQEIPNEDRKREIQLLALKIISKI